MRVRSRVLYSAREQTHEKHGPQRKRNQSIDRNVQRRIHFAARAIRTGRAVEDMR